jgi:hypothetical protein
MGDATEVGRDDGSMVGTILMVGVGFRLGETVGPVDGFRVGETEGPGVGSALVTLKVWVRRHKREGGRHEEDLWRHRRRDLLGTRFNWDPARNPPVQKQKEWRMERFRRCGGRKGLISCSSKVRT